MDQHSLECLDFFRIRDLLAERRERNAAAIAGTAD